MVRLSAVFAVLLMLVTPAAAQTAAERLSITTGSVAKAAPGQNYFLELRTRGGTPPLSWKVTAGSLPPGLTLDRGTGRITGLPESAGDFRFTVAVRDSDKPPQVATEEFAMKVAAPLTVEWRPNPNIEDKKVIRGAVVVTNGTDDAFDLTFFAVAVNEIGKAFALGYQHFRLAPESSSPLLEFGASVPAGHYIVHVDTVAEVPSRNAIYRARLQTAAPLAVTAAP